MFWTPAAVRPIFRFDLPRRYSCHLTAVDASPAMIRLAEQAVSQAGLSDRITVQCERFEAVPGANVFDAVLSNSLLHHLLIRCSSGISSVNSGRHVLRWSWIFCGQTRPKSQAIVDRYASGSAHRVAAGLFQFAHGRLHGRRGHHTTRPHEFDAAVIDVIDDQPLGGAGRSTDAPRRHALVLSAVVLAILAGTWSVGGAA